jgi:hypothetical protein
MVTAVDPGPAGPEPLRAKELKNRAVILKPIARGEEKSKEPGDAPWVFAECDVWLLDRSGIERHETGVRISWKRVLPQLEDRYGQYVICRPKELDGGVVVLVGLEGDAREVAERVVSELNGSA